MAGHNVSKLKKEFSEFARKIEELELLRKELNALDTKGFESEERVIRAKLKNVNAIPEIRKEINALKNEISRRKKRKTVFVKRKVNVGIIKENSGLKRKIAELEKLINKKRKISVKKQLSKGEIEFVKDIPKLETKLNELRRAFEEHMKSSKMRIDSGVGVLVDAKFGDFIATIKSELTQRLKEKELLIDQQLKTDLESREKVFAREYANLVKELHDRYKNEVNNELKREVRTRFEEKLQNRLNNEKNKIVKLLIKENLRRLHFEKQNIINELEGRYDNKEKRLIDSFKRKRRES